MIVGENYKNIKQWIILGEWNEYNDVVFEAYEKLKDEYNYTFVVDCEVNHSLQKYRNCLANANQVCTFLHDPLRQ